MRSATRIRIPLLVLCVAFLCDFAARDCLGNGVDEIDRFVRSEMARRQIPGAAIVAVKNGKIVKRANYGLANVELGVPVTSKTSFEIASMTKAFTAAAVLLLVEDGKLKLDDSIRNHLAGLPDAWQQITVQMLLNHTSGLVDDWDENNAYFLSNFTDDHFVWALSQKPLRFTPGERYSYSCGPFLAGLIVQKAAGIPYAEFMQKRVFDRLGMRSTHVINEGRIVPDRASGYVVRNGFLQNGVRISPAAQARADVGIRTTANDLVKWDAALNKPGFLAKESLEAMFAYAAVSDGSRVPSGLGWWLNPMRGRRVQQHGGAFRTGFNSTINRYPDDGLTVIYLTNVFRGAANDTGHRVAGVYLRRFRSLSKRIAKTDPNEGQTRALENLLGELRTGVYDSAMLSASFPRRFYQPDDWTQLSDSKPQISFIDCEQQRDVVAFGATIAKICYYRISGANEKFVSFWSGTDGKIVYIEPYEF